MPDNKPYKPVSCDIHSQFELLIMHNRSLELVWHEESGNTHTATVKPVDIQTHSGEENLIVIDNKNTQHKIRLDRIQSFKEV